VQRFRRVIRPRFNTRVAAAILGVRIAGPQSEERFEAGDGPSPSWPPELDHYQELDELSRVLSDDLEQVLEARIAPSRFTNRTLGAIGSGCRTRRRHVRGDQTRRSRCPQTRP
jgi:hypothetical protein